MPESEEITSEMRNLGAFARRVAGSAVAWSLGFNFLRLASGLLLLPLLLRMLPKPELGMYYVFLSLNAIVVVLDLGFSPTVGRFVNYAMGGAKRLSAHGLAEEPLHGSPNYALLWELLGTARIFYAFVVLGIFVLLGTFGSFLVWQKVGETSSVSFTWAAWGVSVVAVAAETYVNVWNGFLRNLNQVLLATRISVAAYSLRLVLACLLLVCGGGLMSLPAASLATSLVILNFSKRGCLNILSPHPAPERIEWRSHFRTIWPNSWRLGLYLGGVYVSSNANVLLCSSFFGLAANAKYGLSLQIINVVSGMAAVWATVKWPLIGQLVAQQKIEAVRRILWPRLWLQVGSFLVLAGAAITLGPRLIQFIGSDKEMLPLTWMALLAANSLLDAHCYFWNTFISLWNRLPMLWPSLATNAVGLALNLIFIRLPGAHPGFLVLGPLLAGMVLNYWFWPNYGARTVGLNWLQFALHGFKGKDSPVAGLKIRPT